MYADRIIMGVSTLLERRPGPREIIADTDVAQMPNVVVYSL
jgi:hypothetical protein